MGFFDRMFRKPKKYISPVPKMHGVSLQQAHPYGALPLRIKRVTAKAPFELAPGQAVRIGFYAPDFDLPVLATIQMDRVRVSRNVRRHVKVTHVQVGTQEVNVRSDGFLVPRKKIYGNTQIIVTLENTGFAGARGTLIVKGAPAINP